MIDIRGPFADILTYLNTGIPTPAPAPVFAATNVTVGEVGQSGQIRAGHTLVSTDFTNMGLAVPLGLWNLSDLTDASGNGRTLVNKGSVPFGVGINGAATTAAQFAGSTAQALYIADTGAADPFRIRTGSWGCWFRTAKRGTDQIIMGKCANSGQQAVFSLAVSATNNAASAGYAITATAFAGTVGVDYGVLVAASDTADDRWHLAVVTHDGAKLRVYVDGALEASGATVAPMFGGSGPVNIGGRGGDGAVNPILPHYGRVDEAFVTADVLTEDQIRALYSTRLTHALAQVPGDARILVRRRRRGGPLATTDFPTTPVRLHNFTAGALTDQGTGGVTLAPVGGGTIVTVGGADGTKDGAYSFSGAHTGLGATDAGLPAGTASRSFGLWMKCGVTGSMGIFSYGTTATGEARIDSFGAGANSLRFISNADVINPAIIVYDGLWHHLVEVDDNAAGDGVKRKVYYDGRLVGGSTVLNSITLAGANKFRLGAVNDGTNPFTGQIDGAFVHSAALTGEQVRALWNVGSQQLAASPKDAADHVEAVTSSDLLLVLDTVESSDSVDILAAP